MGDLLSSLDWATILPLVGSIAYFSVGFTMCFKGFRAFKMSLAALFAVLGGYSGYKLYLFAVDKFDFSNPDIAKLIFIGLVAIVFASLSYSLYDKAVVLLTAFATCYLFYNGYISFLIDPSGMSKTKALLIGLGLGVVCGIAIHFLQRIAIKMFTSLSGGYCLALGVTPYLLTVDGVGSFFGQIYDDIFTNTAIHGEQALLTISLTIILAFFGFTSQLKDR